MKKRTPPFITPVALLSLIIALSAGNAVVNVSTNTRNGAPVKETSEKKDTSSTSTEAVRDTTTSDVVNDEMSSGVSKTPNDVSNSESTVTEENSSATSEVPAESSSVTSESSSSETTTDVVKKEAE